MALDDKILQNFFSHPPIKRKAFINIPFQEKDIVLNKLDTNQTQSEHKLNTKPDTNQTQSEHKLNTKNKKKLQTRHKVNTQLDTRLDTNQTQSEHKLNTKTPFSSLVGIQKQITIFIYSLCKTTLTKITEPLTIEYLATSLRIRSGSIKTTISRLQEKGILSRIGFKNGRAGWSKYEIEKTIYNEIMQIETGHKVDTNWTQSRHKVDTQLNTQLNTSASSSSGSNNIYNKTTTTTDNVPKIELNAKWKEIDIEPLAQMGFTKTHLEQIASQNILEPEIVQDSIYAYAFDLETNNKSKSLKGDPLSFFMGILRRGRPYAPPTNYESPKDREMRVYLERKREIEQRRVAMEKEAFDLSFKEWFYQLKDDEIRKLLPPNINYTKGGKIAESAAKEHFTREIWANKQLEILK